MHYFRVHFDEPEPFDAVLIELVNGQQIHDLLDQLYRSNPRLLASDVILMRLPVGRSITPSAFADLKKTGEWSKDLSFLSPDGLLLDDEFRRVPGRPVHFLFSHDHSHFLSENMNAGASTCPLDDIGGESRNKIFDAIRCAEIDYLLEVGKAKLPKRDGFLYLAPSGDLVPSFMRIGNLQHSRAAIDAIFFWLLPHLENCAGIITETWSISSIALNASRRLATYGSHPRVGIPVEMLTSYFDGTELQTADAAERVERLLALAEERRFSFRRKRKPKRVDAIKRFLA